MLLIYLGGVAGSLGPVAAGVMGAVGAAMTTAAVLRLAILQKDQDSARATLTGVMVFVAATAAATAFGRAFSRPRSGPVEPLFHAGRSLLVGASHLSCFVSTTQPGFVRGDRDIRRGRRRRSRGRRKGAPCRARRGATTL